MSIHGSAQGSLLLFCNERGIRPIDARIALAHILCEKAAIDKDFPGGGHVFRPDGRRIFATLDGSAGMVVVDTDKL